MDFEEKLEMYASLLICHGLNVQKGQVVNINGEIVHRELIKKLVKAAYRQGAKYVNVDFVDTSLTRLRIEESKEEKYLQYVPSYIPVKFESFMDEHAAVLRLDGGENPEIFSDLPGHSLSNLQKHYRQSLKRYYEEGISKSHVQWTVAAGATPKWGKKVFPELSEKEALSALWEAIFHICRADNPRCLELWQEHNKKLHDRAQKLTKLHIKKLHFTGPETDLQVFLSEKARFKGGGGKTSYGVAFEANIPTEECFTTPDSRFTEGKVAVTRPVLVNGKQIKGLQLEFKQGRVTHFTAKEGKDHFEAFLSTDPGASFLGEVSLVGIDSPIYQSKRVFEEILFDENAACHIALGMAYRFCIEGGDKMQAVELEAIGCNDSHVHTDFMISSEEVDVEAETYKGEKVSLINKGKWN